MGLEEGQRVWLQKRMVDVFARGVGDVRCLRLGHGDGFARIEAVGQDTTNVWIECSIVGWPWSRVIIRGPHTVTEQESLQH